MKANAALLRRVNRRGTAPRLQLCLLISISALLGQLCSAAPGDLYVATGGYYSGPNTPPTTPGAIYRIDPSGKVSTFASNIDARAVAFDAAGNLFASDRAGNTVFKFARDGTKTAFASVPTPSGLVFDRAGNLYVASQTDGVTPYPNTCCGSIIKVTPDGQQTTIYSDPLSGQPLGITLDAAGNVYSNLINRGTADPKVPRTAAILVIGPDGSVNTFYSDPSPFLVGQLAFDSSGNLFLASDGGYNVLEFTPDGVKTIYASNFAAPQGLAFDSVGNLFVSEGSSGNITKLGKDGSRSTFANVKPADQQYATAAFLAFEPGPVGPPAQLQNISTRMQVLTDNNVLIGGFIITGTDQKKVLVRGLGPSLPVTNALADPTLELHDANATLASNDNWKDTQQADIQATTVPPANDAESAIVQTLNANNSAYTAILAGKNRGTGIGLVEVYDLAPGANSQLANISTRGFVDTGTQVLIGGLIAGPSNSSSSTVVVRAIGPSLQSAGIANALQDPTLELHDVSGALVASNDNWKDSQQQEIVSTHLMPSDDRESAIVRILAPGNYTAVVRGKNNTTGVGLVEAYNLH